MSRLLALDIGSSSVKAAIVARGRIVGATARAPIATEFRHDRAEVPAGRIFRAVAEAIGSLGKAARRVDSIAISAMGPSWLAMDRHGRALTPVVTHQDRRSVEQARQIERTVDKSRHLRLAGNRPFPGGISSTTALWFAQNARAVMKRADLVGHVPTMLIRAWCGTRAIDTSHASFTGLYRTLTLGGWCDELLDAAKITQTQLPRVLEAGDVAGLLTQSAADELALTAGTPVLAGIVDGSVPMLLAGARPGQVVNVCGSSDVLAVCTADPKPHERLLTRALGIGRKWVHVGTLAAAGSSIAWTHRALFADLDDGAFAALLKRQIDAILDGHPTEVTFDPFLAGDRTSVEQRKACFAGLQLSTGREAMLRAVLIALRGAGAERVRLLRSLSIPMKQNVLIAGGPDALYAKLMTSSWPGQWRFKRMPDATLAGLGELLQ